MSWDPPAWKCRLANVYVANPKRRDFHISAFMRATSAADEDEAHSLLRWLKDNGPCEVWPVYERLGWWTTVPTHEVRVVAVEEATKRNATEQGRLALHLGRHRSDAPLHALATAFAATARASHQTVLTSLPSPTRSDPCLRRIDTLVAAGQDEG